MSARRFRTWPRIWATGSGIRRRVHRVAAAPVVVFDGSLALLLFGERDVEVEVEVAAERGRPGKRPSHPPLVRLQLCERRPRHGRKRDVVVRQMDGEAVEPIRDRRAGRTARLVVGPEHEVIDEELRAPSEEICQRGATFIGLESILLVDANPWQLLRRRASSSLRRVSSFSASSSSSRAASQSSRVPIMCFVICLSFVLFCLSQENSHNGSSPLDHGCETRGKHRPVTVALDCSVVVIEQGRISNGESDKCVGIPMDSLITAAARALAAGDPLGALNRVALRDDAPALALRGIAMAQLGDLVRAKALLRSAARAFSPKEAVARARCVVAEAEIAFVSRDLGWPAKALDAARAMLEAHGDRVNAAHARYLELRRLLLIGRLDEAERKLADIDPSPFPPASRTAHELVVAGIAMRRLRTKTARAALARAELAARDAGIPALTAEVESASLV